MLRLLAIIFLLYIFLRGLVLIMRTLMGTGIHGNASRGSFSRTQKPKSGNLKVDYSPKTPKQNTDFKGGDYVDYEEVE